MTLDIKNINLFLYILFFMLTLFIIDGYNPDLFRVSKYKSFECDKPICLLNECFN